MLILGMLWFEIMVCVIAAVIGLAFLAFFVWCCMIVHRKRKEEKKQWNERPTRGDWNTSIDVSQFTDSDNNSGDN